MLPDVPRDRLLELYRRMLLIRRFEEELLHLTDGGHNFGHFHLYIGEEAIGVPALAQLGPEDSTATTFRNHGHLLARGADPGRLLAEIMGKATGYCKGKSGTLHATVRELGFLSTSAAVGGVLPLATGAGFAAKQLGTKRVSVCCFGDGAMEEGAFYESINLAALWALPVIYLCENNSFGAPGVSAGEYSSSTISGPSFIEAQVYRWPGNRPLWPKLLTGTTDPAMAWDPARIPKDHAEWHTTHDCVLRYTRELLAAGAATPDAVLAIDGEVRAAIARARAFALESPEPAPEAALEDVFA